MKLQEYVKIILLILCATLSSVVFSRTVLAADSVKMFEPPNSHAKVLVQYYNRNQSFKFCWPQYDVINKTFLNTSFCVKNDHGRQDIFFALDIRRIKVSAPEIIVRYNTLDRGLVDKTYRVALDSISGGVNILNPEDKTDIVNMLMNSRDIIVFYQSDDPIEFQMVYYPLPIRDKDGSVLTQEVQ